uniref:Uncharacterized protein n=1 Tax=Arundo donax TaxID=35708 RepID=A0A0A9HB18_ARUDO
MKSPLVFTTALISALPSLTCSQADRV